MLWRKLARYNGTALYVKKAYICLDISEYNSSRFLSLDRTIQRNVINITCWVYIRKQSSIPFNLSSHNSYVHDYTAHMDYMELHVRCSKKAAQLKHTLSVLITMTIW